MTGVWRRLASQSLLLFGARLAGAALVFATQAMIARRFGAPALGDYLLLIAGVNIAATAMPLGFQVVGGYFAAEYRATGDRCALKAFLARAYGHVMVAAALFAAAAWLLAPPSMAGLWPPTLAMAVATAVVFVNGAILVGLKRPVAGFVADTLLRPMLMLLGFLAALAMAADAPLATLMSVAAAGYAGVALIQFAATCRAVATVADGAGAAPAIGERRRWWRFALPWAALTLLTDFFFDIDLMLLAPLLERDELAVFGVCARVCALLAFGVGAVHAVTMPDILEAGARRDAAAFRRRIGDANLIAVVIASASAVAMLASGPALGLLFGPAFAQGAVPLAIMAAGLVVRAAVGPAALILSFHNRPAAAVPAALLAVVALALGNLALVPPLGLTGAALSALLAMILWSVALWLTARRATALDVSILPRLREWIAPPSRPQAEPVAQAKP